MFENSSMSPADIGAIMGNSDSGFNGIWVLIIIFIVLFAGGGWGGNSNTRVGEVYSTQADIQRAVDLDTLKSGQSAISDVVRTTTADTISAVKDLGYNQLGEIRDIQNAISLASANQQNCCCENLRAIDSVNYNGAINTASINANTTAQVQKVLDAVTTNRMADMQNQINQLQLQSAVCGIPKVNPYYYSLTPPVPPYPFGTTIS